jgi:hypothetical protein
LLTIQWWIIIFGFGFGFGFGCIIKIEIEIEIELLKAESEQLFLDLKISSRQVRNPEETTLINAYKRFKNTKSTPMTRPSLNCFF